MGATMNKKANIYEFYIIILIIIIFISIFIFFANRQINKFDDRCIEMGYASYHDSSGEQYCVDKNGYAHKVIIENNNMYPLKECDIK